MRITNGILTELHSGQVESANVTCSTSNASSCNLLCIRIVSCFENFKLQATHTQIFLKTKQCQTVTWKKFTTSTTEMTYMTQLFRDLNFILYAFLELFCALTQRLHCALFLSTRLYNLLLVVICLQVIGDVFTWKNNRKCMFINRLMSIYCIAYHFSFTRYIIFNIFRLFVQLLRCFQWLKRFFRMRRINVAMIDFYEKNLHFYVFKMHT